MINSCLNNGHLVLLDWMLIFCLQVHHSKWSPSFTLNLPTKYTTSFNQWAWPCETSWGKSGSLESSMLAARTEQSDIKSNFRVKSISVLPWSLRKSWSLFKSPLQLRDWRMRCRWRGMEKEKSWLTLEVRAIWQWPLSLHSLPRSIHLITKWGYNAYLLKHISPEKGRIRMNCIHWNRVKKEKDSKRD